MFIIFISGSCHNEFSGNKGKAAKNPRLVQHQYPIFIFYPKDRRGIQYNGPISVQSILEFLLLARKPATHLGLKNDLVNLRANHGNAHISTFGRLNINEICIRAIVHHATNNSIVCNGQWKSKYQFSKASNAEYHFVN